MNRSQVVDDARVTLNDVRADEESVVIGFTVQDLEDGRRNAGMAVALDLMLADNSPEALRPHRGRLTTDEAGRYFYLVRARTGSPDPGDGPETVRAPKEHTAVFRPFRNLKPGTSHRLRFEVSLHQWAVPPSREEAEGVRVEPRPPIGPFVFDFEVPVRRAQIVEVGEQAEAGGITLTLERVVNSPNKPRAIVRFDPPDDGRSWVPRLRKDWLAASEAAAPGQREGSRWWLAMDGPAEGRSSVVVEYLRGVTPGGSPHDVRVICGPWTFEFEAPAP